MDKIIEEITRLGSNAAGSASLMAKNLRAQLEEIVTTMVSREKLASKEELEVIKAKLIDIDKRLTKIETTKK